MLSQESSKEQELGKGRNTRMGKVNRGNEWFAQGVSFELQDIC